MQWKIEFGDDFDKEFAELREDIQDELLAHSQLMSQFGPTLGRPQVDTLKGSQFSNMTRHSSLTTSAVNGVRIGAGSCGRAL